MKTTYVSLCLALNNVLILFLHVTAKKRRIVPITTQDSIIITSDEDASGEDNADVEQTSATHAYVLRKHDSTLNIITAKWMQASLGTPKEVDNKGLLMDIDVQPIDEDVPLASHKDKRHDIDHFFQSLLLRRLLMERLKNIVIASSAHTYHIPRYVWLLMRSIIYSHRDKKSIVNEVTTLHRHLEAHHSVSWLLL